MKLYASGFTNVDQRAVRGKSRQHMVRVNLITPVAAGNLAEVPEVPDGDELRLVKRQDFHLGLDGGHRVVGHIDVERADLEGVLEILAAQVAPDLTEGPSRSPERPERS